MPHVPLGRPATYDDVLAAPEHLVAEIVDGEFWTSPRPAPKHARAFSSLTGALAPPYDLGRGGPGGWWILGEPELHLGSDVLVPDLAGWRRSRMPQLPKTAYFALAPEWVCEIISPSTARLDRSKKLHAYAREGIAHCWIIDPLAYTLEVLRLEAGRWTIVSTHAGDEIVRPEPFDGVDIELAWLWEPTPDKTPADRVQSPQ